MGAFYRASAVQQCTRQGLRQISGHIFTGASKNAKRISQQLEVPRCQETIIRSGCQTSVGLKNADAALDECLRSAVIGYTIIS